MNVPKFVEYYPDESIFSLISRLSAANHYATPSYIYRAVFKRYPNNNPNLINNPDGLSFLEQLSHIKYERLLQLVYCRKGKSDFFTVGTGKKLHRFVFHSKGTKICPRCISEAWYARRTWEITLVTTCVKHRCLLLDCCPNCGQRISWLWPSQTGCLCGFNYSDTEPDEIPIEQVAITSRLEQLVLGVNTPKPAVDLPSILVPLRLEYLTTLLFFFGGQFVGQTDLTGKTLGGLEDNIKTHALMVKVPEVFSSWPESFYAFLDWQRNRRSGGAGDTGIQRDFGAFNLVIGKGLLGNEYDFLRNAYARYLETWDGGYLSSKNMINVNGGMLLSGTDAAALLKTTCDKVKRLVESGQLKGKTAAMGKRTLILVESDSVKAYKGLIESSCTLQEAAEILGIGHHGVVDLIRNGIIKALNGPTIDSSPVWRVDTKSIYDLLRTFNQSLVYPDGKENTLTFSQIIRRFSASGLTTVNVVQAILQGIVVPVAITRGIGLKQFSFSEKQIVALKLRNCKVQIPKSHKVEAKEEPQRVNIDSEEWEGDLRYERE